MSDSDDDVVFIPNPTGKAQLPHARCACETHIFVAPPGGQLRHHGTAKNKEKCATCFCYVCCHGCALTAELSHLREWRARETSGVGAPVQAVAGGPEQGGEGPVEVVDVPGGG